MSYHFIISVYYWKPHSAMKTFLKVKLPIILICTTKFIHQNPVM